MYLIVGLGNPEIDYSNTRHNMGFNVINKIAQKYEIDISRNKFRGLYGTGIIENNKVILLKPQTFMNLSGESIIEFKNFYKLENNEIIVIYDDMDLKVGEIRVRKKGGPRNSQWNEVCCTLFIFRRIPKSTCRNWKTTRKYRCNRICYRRYTRRRKNSFTRRNRKSKECNN